MVTLTLRPTGGSTQFYLDGSSYVPLRPKCLGSTGDSTQIYWGEKQLAPPTPFQIGFTGVAPLQRATSNY